MYEDSLKVENKIIDSSKIGEIFLMMNDEIERLTREANEEKRRNETIDYSHQEWNYKYFSGKLSFDVEFYDSTTITFDNYNNFISIYNSRLDEIKRISPYYSLSYTVHKPGYVDETIHQHIRMYIGENKFEAEVKIASRDNNVNKIYEAIKNMILFAPEKYDRIIKNKNVIMTKVGFAIGFIPALLIGLVLLFVPGAREVFKSTYVLLPIGLIMVAYIIGKVFSTLLLSDCYNTLIRDKKYAYYDVDKRKSVYKDDIDTYVSKCEVLIGKNANNMKYREEIEKIEKQFNPFLLPEVFVLILMSILSVVI